MKNDRNDRQREDLHRVRIGAILDQCPKLLHVWDVRERDTYAVASPDGRLVATVDASGIGRIRDLTSDRVVSAALGHDGSVTTLAFSPDGQVLVSAGADKTARIWDPRTGKAIGPLLEHPLAAKRLHFSRDGRILIVQYSGNGWKIWDTRDGKLIADPGPGEVTDPKDEYVAFSPAGPWERMGSIIDRTGPVNSMVETATRVPSGLHTNLSTFAVPGIVGPFGLPV